MKRLPSPFARRSLLAGLFALVAPLSVGAAMAGPGPTADVPPGPPPVVDGGAELYAKSCNKCHGPDGKGETGMGKKGREKGERWPDLSASKLARDKTLAIIRDGVTDTAMKGYGEKLSADELEQVTDFVLGLRK